VARHTVLQAAIDIRSQDSMQVEAVVDTGYGSGIVLSTRHDSPGVLGLGVIDDHGESVALALSEEEAMRLRDALADWLQR
jgi:hypothetical protein